MATNPLLKDTTLYRINGLGLVLAFLVFRVVLNTAAVTHMLVWTWSVHWPLVYIKTPLFVTLALTLTSLAVGHTALNLIWFMQIVRAATRKLGRRRTTKTIIAAEQSHVASNGDSASASTHTQNNSSHSHSE